ncbi:AraC family transcriptional regulator [Methylobacterium sp. 092160098-2]|uniref:AraC family transcriptional regulator n=1 Tax=Methylobacterium sp. 092160098-2 TaxID=3025129 RepID=UPI002381C77D|nr:AraC family transcriptional regulator [Methylobacterium sp. 092160098-2]MDE4915201.1 AraC family transcriptional regulator [Methylobacterium sp. 092160098-2]
MAPSLDWLSRLLAIVPVRGRLDTHCTYGAPWRIDQPGAEVGEMAYHVVLAGSAALEDPAGGPPLRLSAGDILLLPHGEAHVLHDGGGTPAMPAHTRSGRNLRISENAGMGERLDMLCGHFVLGRPQDRLLRDYLPSRLVVRTVDPAGTAASGTREVLASLVLLMRQEAITDTLGGQAMLDALSTALFALTLRLASEGNAAPVGLLALVSNARLAPALSALLNEPDRPWTLPALARLCSMSRATAARRFQDALGRSASELLADIRMTLAAGELRKPSAVTSAVAGTVGYQSEAAFQRAFKQRMGMTPAQWRRLPQPIARRSASTLLKGEVQNVCCDRLSKHE